MSKIGCGKYVGYRHLSGATAYCGDNIGTRIIYCEKCQRLFDIQQVKPNSTDRRKEMEESLDCEDSQSHSQLKEMITPTVDNQQPQELNSLVKGKSCGEIMPHPNILGKGELKSSGVEDHLPRGLSAEQSERESVPIVAKDTSPYSDLKDYQIDYSKLHISDEIMQRIKETSENGLKINSKPQNDSLIPDLKPYKETKTQLEIYKEGFEAGKLLTEEKFGNIIQKSEKEVWEMGYDEGLNQGINRKLKEKK